jgi:ribonuclease HI
VTFLHTYSDGGARGNPGPSAIGVVLCDEHDNILFETAQCIGDGTNNRAEYRAMLLALESAKERGARRLLCSADSELLIFQLQGTYRIKNAQLKVLSEKVKSLAAEFEEVRYRQVPREHPLISRADHLLNQALDRARSETKPHGGHRPTERSQGELF